MPTTAIADFAAFQEAINSETPVIIDFWATWCGPCKMISPIFEKLSNSPENAALKFYKVDTDANERAATEAGVRVMPTFMVFHKGNKIAESPGAVPQKLAALIKEGVAAATESATAKESAAAVEAPAAESSA